MLISPLKILVGRAGEGEVSEFFMDLIFFFWFIRTSCNFSKLLKSEVHPQIYHRGVEGGGGNGIYLKVPKLFFWSFMSPCKV